MAGKERTHGIFEMDGRHKIVQLLSVAGFVAASACEPIPPESIQTHQDLGAMGSSVDAGVGSNDAGSSALAPDVSSIGDDTCSRDDDCDSLSWCSEIGECEPRQNRPFFETIQDGLTRVGAASFSLVPDRFETWNDRASSECPNNRIHRFDGRLDNAKPEDPCADTFDDADSDGVFDAIWLGGPGLDRPAKDVDSDNPPEGRVLIIARDDALSVILTLDLFELDRGRIELLTGRLRGRLGLGPHVLSIHSAGVRSGPDATGLAGPSRRISASLQQDAFHRRSRGAFAFLDNLPVD